MHIQLYIHCKVTKVFMSFFKEKSSSHTQRNATPNSQNLALWEKVTRWPSTSIHVHVWRDGLLVQQIHVYYKLYQHCCTHSAVRELLKIIQQCVCLYTSVLMPVRVYVMKWLLRGRDAVGRQTITAQFLYTVKPQFIWTSIIRTSLPWPMHRCTLYVNK